MNVNLEQPVLLKETKGNRCEMIDNLALTESMQITQAFHSLFSGQIP